MLFKISEIVNIDSYSALTKEDRKKVDSNINLLAAYSSNEELFLLSHQFFNPLLKVINITDFERQYLKEITERLSVISDIDSKVSVYIELTFLENETEIVTAIENEIRIIKIDIRNRMIVTIARRPKFLCEDLYDIDAYEIILKYYINISKVFKWYLFEPVHGGGSKTAILFERYYDEGNTMCLCIYDTDIKYKGGSKSSIANRIERRKKNEINPFVEAISFEDLREIENAIPQNLMHEIKPTMISTNLLRGNLISNCCRESWKYLDMKKGLKESRLCSCERTKERQYWRRVIQSQKLILEEDNYVSGYGDNLLQEFTNLIKDKPYLISGCNYRVDEFISEYWLSIGKQIYSWLCTYKLVR